MRRRDRLSSIFENHNNSKIGACVLNWNSGPALVHCLRSLENTSGSPIDIVIVDNASTDDSLGRARIEFPKIPVIANSQNWGFAAGHNLGAARLLDRGCEFVVFLNPDVILEARTISRLAEALAEDPRAGLAGGAPFSPEDDAQYAARTRPSAIEKLVMYGPLHRIPALGSRYGKHLRFAGDDKQPRREYAICGACMMFRADAFREIGGFDESTFLYEEEMISAERLRAKSWETILVPQAAYRHAIGGSTDALPYRRRLYFVDSEQHLVREYYRWNPVLCSLLRLYRYVEWVGYAVYRSLTKSSPRARKARPDDALEVSRYSR